MTPRARLVVLVSGRGSNLRAIADAIDAGHCAAEIVAVVSDKKDALALDFAVERGIATQCVPFSKGDDRAAWNQTLLDVVASHDPTFVVLAGFMRILGNDFIDRFTRRIVNVHPSLLPAFPGHDGPAQAIAHGARITGCTVHLVDHGVDTGPILAQGAVPILPEDDVPSLHARIQRIEHRLLPAVLQALAIGALDPDSPRHPQLAFDEAASLVSPSLLP